MTKQRETTIKVDGLWKYYGLPPLRYSRILRRWWKALRYGRNYSDRFVPPASLQGIVWALQDISFEVYRGEMLGIIGLNGSGKSTLLKVLAGTTPPNYGTVVVHGKLFSMIELNAGMNPELTGRENSMLLGAVMGFSTQEIKEQVPEIEDFCELGEWFDRPIRTYSSGMMARLGFGVAVNVNADILLVDEVLAVGDMPFQRKSFDRMEKVRNSNKAVVYVSHSIRQVERLCNRVMLLNNGRIVAIGDPADVIGIYEEMTELKTEQGKKHVNKFGIDPDAIPAEHQQQETSNTEDKQPLAIKMTEGSQIGIVDVSLYNQRGEKTDTFYTGDTMYGEIEYTSAVDVENAIVGVSVSTLDRLSIFNFTSEGLDFPIPVSQHGYLRFMINNLPLLKGKYAMNLKIKKYNEATLGGAADIKIFRMVVPGEIRLSSGSGFGLIKTDSSWLQTGSSFPFEKEQIAGCMPVEKA